MRNNFKRLGCLARLPRCRVHGAESLPAELCLARRVLSCRSFAPKAQGRAPACLPCLRRTPGAGDVCSRHEGLPRTGGASALTGSGVLPGVVWLSAACIAEEERFRRAGSCVADGRRRGHARRRRGSPGPPRTDLRLRFRPWRSGRPPASPSPVVSPAPAGMVYVPLQSPPRGGTAFKRRGSRNPKRCVSLFLKLRLWCLRPAVSPDSGIA